MSAQDKLMQFIENSRCLLDNFPGLYFIKDMKSNYVECNQAFSHAFDVKKTYLLEHTDYDMSWESFASLFRDRDQETVSTGNPVQSFEPIPLCKKRVLIVKTFKSPIRDSTGDIIGLFGQINLLGMDHELCRILAAISMLDQQSKAGHNRKRHDGYKISYYPTSFKLTSRETECLFLLVRGKSAKEIAQFLEISPRTVEEYIENIKSKLRVSSRSEIIAKAVEKGLLDIIPRHEILSGLFKNKDKWCDFLYGGI